MSAPTAALLERVRHRLATITSRETSQASVWLSVGPLCDALEAAEARCTELEARLTPSDVDRAFVEALTDKERGEVAAVFALVRRAERAEAVNRVAAEQFEAEAARATAAEQAANEAQRLIDVASDRAEQAEAALERVRALAIEWEAWAAAGREDAAATASAAKALSAALADPQGSGNTEAGR